MAQVKFYSNLYSCISIFFDEEMIESLHFQTNLYCTQKGRAGSITKDELYAFFEINILMSHHKFRTERVKLSFQKLIRPVSKFKIRILYSSN